MALYDAITDRITEDVIVITFRNWMRILQTTSQMQATHLRKPPKAPRFR